MKITKQLELILSLMHWTSSLKLVGKRKKERKTTYVIYLKTIIANESYLLNKK